MYIISPMARIIVDFDGLRDQQNRHPCTLLTMHTLVEPSKWIRNALPQLKEFRNAD